MKDTLLATMNRDEARSRGPESPPVQYDAPTGRIWTGPSDDDTGGSWFGVNDNGIVACILNRYQDDSDAIRPEHVFTRAVIVPLMLSLHSLDEIKSRLSGPVEDWLAYPPFTLVVATLGDALRVDWNGKTMRLAPLAQPWDMVTSSGLDTARVIECRQVAFDRWIREGAPKVEGIPAIHLHRPPGDEEVAPLMSRELSSTRSISQALVCQSGSISLRYGAVRDGAVDWDSLLHVHALETMP